MCSNLIQLGKQGRGKKDNNKVILIINIIKNGRNKGKCIIILLIIVAGHIVHLKIKAARLC